MLTILRIKIQVRFLFIWSSLILKVARGYRNKGLYNLYRIIFFRKALEICMGIADHKEIVHLLLGKLVVSFCDLNGTLHIHMKYMKGNSL
ncbi:hypothetical protein Back11_07300 [Paenibacillus baekrokdamisoli]|uniref:Uncharacterized protein n=1 Tax=Paenibacillus baekrokdamisoli TaxID=1712516 RepID=A0A3G9ITK8_9BACL|nr:hypothetical protein Back11_07300 [Paenibacillus baekrokdamisoli]